MKYLQQTFVTGMLLENNKRISPIFKELRKWHILFQSEPMDSVQSVSQKCFEFGQKSHLADYYLSIYCAIWC